MSDAREINLPQQLWETLDTMAKEMGVARDSLVSQAVFTLARLNGYVIPGKVVLGTGAISLSSSQPAHSPAHAPANGTGGAAKAPLSAKAAHSVAPAPPPAPAPN